MSIFLGGVELPDLVNADEWSAARVAAVVERSVINTPIVFEGEQSTGQPITLVGGDDTAWITRQTLLAIKALADVPGATYTLSYEGVATVVRFRNEDPPAVFAEPLVPRPNAASTDYYRNVTIKLMEV